MNGAWPDQTAVPEQRTPARIIQNKLVVPQLPERHVARPRLDEELDRGTAGPVTLLAAPPGSGKTVALASWVRLGAPPGPVAWLSLDGSDCDPVRFGTYLVTALCRSGAVPPDSALWSALPLAEADDALLSLLVEGFQDLETPVVLVLDDVHVITERRVLALLEGLIRHARPQLRLVMTARWDPLLPLRRLAMDGSLVELRAEELAFTKDEVVALMERCGHLGRLSFRDVHVLHERTEGWVAGLCLAAASMEGEGDLHGFVQGLAGDDHSLAGYLMSEVLSRQPDDRRRFLLYTSVVDELTPDLAAALTERDDAAGVLAELERTKSFVTAVGSGRHRYRFHALFAELLRSELRMAEPGQEAVLRRRAAVWYHEHDAPFEALQQATRLEDWDLVADVLLEHGFRPTFSGAPAPLETLLERVPAEARSRDARLAVLAAAFPVLTGADREGALLDLALERVDEIAPGRRAAFAVVLGTCWMLRATADGDVDSALAAGWYVLEGARESGGWERRGGVVRAGMVVTLGRLGQAELWLGETDAALDHLRLAHREALDAGMAAEQVASLGYLAVAQAFRGRLSAARSDADTALARATAVKRVPPAATAPAWFASALVHYGRDDIGLATGALDSVAHGDVHRTDPLRVAGRILDARCRWAEGDTVAAMKGIQSARHDLTLTPHARALSTWLTETEAGMHLQLGDLPAARWTLRSAVLGDRPPAPVVVMSARLKLAEGEPAVAVHLLQGVVDRAVASDDLAQRLQVALVLVPALHAQGSTEEAGRVLQDLVAGAAAENHRRLILDAGEPARTLLAASRTWSDSTWPFLDELALATSDPSVSPSPQVPVHVEPLSERERDVLRYLPTMLTFAEIGSELYISVNTTKSHVRSIYRKLGVEGRRDAVRRARQFQLLRP